MKDILSYYEVEDAEEKHVQDLIQQLPKVKRKTNVFEKVHRDTRHLIVCL